MFVSPDAGVLAAGMSVVVACDLCGKVVDQINERLDKIRPQIRTEKATRHACP
ncbi:hypothetical protein [Flexibacterium corallicola]|uniref:hypothetical protein n=1 Tax=Flexibacterium corallicola TaxID=3037259 RepID=UPI00286F0A55|nr:hypothetical protein [Pseudovibrio sp. M1P-2-3]